jgi:hypothetical protein
MYADIHCLSVIGYEGVICDHQAIYVFRPFDDNQMCRQVEPEEFMAFRLDWRFFKVAPKSAFNFRLYELVEINATGNEVASFGKIEFKGQWVTDIGAFELLCDAIVALVAHGDKLGMEAIAS